MQDTALTQVRGRLEQVRAVALELVEGEPALLSDAAAQRWAAGVLQLQGQVTADAERLPDRLEDPRVVQLGQCLVLSGEPCLLGGVMRDLQHALGLEISDQQRQTRRSGAETLEDDEPAVEDGVDLGLKRVHRGLGLGVREVGEERLHVGCAVHPRVGMRGTLDQVPQPVRHLIEFDGRVEALAAADALLEGADVRCRRMVGDEQIADGAEAINVEGDPVGLVSGVDLGGQVDPSLRIGHVGDVPGAQQYRGRGRGRAAINARLLAAGLPVADADAHWASAGAVDEDLLG